LGEDSAGPWINRKGCNCRASKDVTEQVRHRNRDKWWACNDIFDIDALSLAVPYCDIVVTDSHRRHVLRTAHLDERMDTAVLAKLTELPTHL
jgi:S-adenosylhomocysteine hydrolase